MGLAKWIYLSRIYYIYEGDIKYDIVPFVYEIEKMKSICYYGNKGSYDDCEINNTFIDKSLASIGSIRKDIKNVSQLFKSDTIGYNFLEKTYIIGWALSGFEIIILFFILKFMSFSSHIFIKKKSFRKQYSLIKLFENHKNICIKCRIPKDDTTIHCIVCNGCVREFDHHCSWLNICICKKNLGWFRGFLYLFCLYILSNLVFFSYSK
jgi:hypothetical protein